MTKDLEIRENLRLDANNAISKATIIEVKDNKTNQLAVIFLKTLKSFQKEMKEEFNPAIEKANDLHKQLTGQRSRFLKPLQDAEQLVKQKVSDFLNEQERIRLDNQRKEREKADAADKKRKADLEAQAKGHDEAGRPEKAEERRQQAEETHTPVPIVESNVTKQEGVSKKVTWKFEIINKNLIPTSYMMPDEKAIGAVVRALKGETKITGIRVYPESSISVKV